MEIPFFANTFVLFRTTIDLAEEIRN